MDGKVTVIKMRWWGHLGVICIVAVVGTLAAAMGWAGTSLLAAPDGSWRGLLLIFSAAFMLFIVLLHLNVLFTYRLEIGASGVHMVGNFWTHHFTWQEITGIRKRLNYRALGYHVLIEVDGSHLPRRHWTHLGAGGYQIPTPMEKGPTELNAYLKRKRREYLKRAQANPASIDG
ncbi:hypothetical protein [Porphyrobacter sp. HT-58-2]|uniref:hypothetical protein n=1 Tax=Porphyrobacter sp. HT-58-2 TaxID=2023229 RepID=UPI0015585D71|nr:hypothetical protein [Porphyrobacter sp. HT-58-2]